MNWIIRYYSIVTLERRHDEILRDMSIDEAKQYAEKNKPADMGYTIEAYKGAR